MMIMVPMFSQVSADVLRLRCHQRLDSGLVEETTAAAELSGRRVTVVVNREPNWSLGLTFPKSFSNPAMFVCSWFNHQKNITWPAFPQQCDEPPIISSPFVASQVHQQVLQKVLRDAPDESSRTQSPGGWAFHLSTAAPWSLGGWNHHCQRQKVVRDGSDWEA